MTKQRPVLTKKNLIAVGGHSWNSLGKSESDKDIRNILTILLGELKSLPEGPVNIISQNTGNLSQGDIFKDLSDESSLDEEEIHVEEVVSTDNADDFKELSEEYYSMSAARIGLISMIEKQPKNSSHKKRLENVESKLNKIIDKTNKMSISAFANNIDEESSIIKKFDNIDEVLKSAEKIDLYVKEIKEKVDIIKSDDFVALSLPGSEDKTL